MSLDHCRRAAVTIALVGLTSAALGQQVETAFVITNVRLFDGERVRDGAQISVVDGLINEVGNSVRRSPSMQVVDGTNATLLPGFIDAHVHVRTADDLRQAIRFGVTTVLEMSAVVADVSALRAKAAEADDMADMRTGGIPATARPRPEFQWPIVRSLEEASSFAKDH